MADTQVYEVLEENFPIKVMHLRENLFLICYRYNGGILEIRDLTNQATAKEVLSRYEIYPKHPQKEEVEEQIMANGGQMTPEQTEIKKQVEQVDELRVMEVIDCDMKGDESNIIVTFFKKWSVKVNMVTKHHQEFGSDQIRKIRESKDDRAMVFFDPRSAARLAEDQMRAQKQMKDKQSPADEEIIQLTIWDTDYRSAVLGHMQVYELIESNNLVTFLKNRANDELFVQNSFGIYAVFDLSSSDFVVTVVGEFNPHNILHESFRSFDRVIELQNDKKDSLRMQADGSTMICFIENVKPEPIQKKPAAKGKQAVIPKPSQINQFVSICRYYGPKKFEKTRLNIVQPSNFKFIPKVFGLRQIKTTLLAVCLDRSIAIHDLCDPKHPRITQIETNNAFEFLIPVSPSNFQVELDVFQQEACAGYSYGCFYECGMVYTKTAIEEETKAEMITEQEEENKMQIDQVNDGPPSSSNDQNLDFIYGLAKDHQRRRMLKKNCKLSSYSEFIDPSTKLRSLAVTPMEDPSTVIIHKLNIL